MSKKPGKPRAPRAAKSSTTPKTPRKGTGGNPRAKPGTNLTNLSEDEVRALFLSNRSEYVAAKAKEAAAKKVVDEAVTQAKSDGFSKKELDLSIDLADLKKEKKVIADVTTRLRVARWMGHKMGNQMDLFAEPDRTPAIDRAFDEGKQASMEGKPRKSPYAQGLPQNDKWFEGFDKDQERLQAGVGRGKPEEGAEPESGLRMSRKDYQAEQVKSRAQRDADEIQAAQPPAETDDDEKLAIH